MKPQRNKLPMTAAPLEDEEVPAELSIQKPSLLGRDDKLYRRDWD